MKNFIAVAAALAITLGSSVALADSGDAPQTSQPVTYSNTTLAAAPLAHDVDVEGQATFGGKPAVVALGGGDFLAANGNEAPLQTANSAPAGFGTDTITLAAHAHGFPHLAQR